MLAVGSQVGAYRVLAELGSGAMGVVYEAREEATGRLVALKVVRPEHAHDAVYMERFRREARAAAAIDHPHVTALRAAGEHEGAPFLVFEHVPGGSLARRLKEEGRLPWREACARGAEVASALAAIHAKGLIHRDLKPENVLLDEHGRAKLTDFGLARRDRTSGAGSIELQTFTEQGDLVGTCEYMAPEQADGQKRIDARADLYALGALVFALVAGRPPFEGHGLAALVRMFQERPPSLRALAPGTPAPLERLVLALLEKDPAARPRTALEVARSLEALATERPRRRSLAPIALGVVLGGVALAGLWAFLDRSPAARPAPGGELVALARKKLLSEDVNGAIADLDRAIALDGKLAVAWQLRGLARKKKREYAGAIADETRALELDPALASGWMVRGAARGATADVDGTVADCSKAIELDPGLAEAWQLRSAARRAKGDLEGAIADATKTIELDPTSASARLERSAARGLARDWAGVIADTSKAIELAPGDATVWQNRAAARAFSGDPDGAIADATRAIELDPRLISAWSTRASVFLVKREPQPAIADFTRAIEVDPTSAESWRGRGQARAKAGDLDGAIEDDTRALELAPGLADAWNDRGTYRGLRGDREGALADLTRAIELDPGFARAWAERGSVRLTCGLVDAAIADDTRAIELDPGLALSWMERGVARGRRGDVDGAIADLSRAIELDATSSGAWGSRGSARYMKGDLGGAIGDFERALELEPQGVHAADVRAQLEAARKRAP